jgi:hypothetical protein
LFNLFGRCALALGIHDLYRVAGNRVDQQGYQDGRYPNSKKTHRQTRAKETPHKETSLNESTAQKT